MGSDKDFSGKEIKAIKALSGFLEREYGIAAHDVDVTIERDVPGLYDKMPQKRDHLHFKVKDPVLVDNGGYLHHGPVQNKLADELAKIWSKNAPLVDVEIPWGDNRELDDMRSGLDND